MKDKQGGEMMMVDLPKDKKETVSKQHKERSTDIGSRNNGGIIAGEMSEPLE